MTVLFYLLNHEIHFSIKFKVFKILQDVLVLLVCWHENYVVKGFGANQVILVISFSFNLSLLNQMFVLAKIIFPVISESSQSSTTAPPAISTTATMSSITATSPSSSSSWGDADLPGHLLADHPGPLDRDGLAMSSRDGVALLHRHRHGALHRHVAAVLLRDVETLRGALQLPPCTGFTSH